MDDVSFSKKANISVINRFDQEVKDIIISASQVALYVFEPKKAKWIKRKVEGACFFYKRKTNPKYGIFILNRLDTTNFIELMNSIMDIQLQEPYILYRNIFKTIYGIWFYEKSECTAMATVFQGILKELKEKEKEEQEVDIIDPLMKDKACSAEVTEYNNVENNTKPNVQPDSVRQFFAKACKEATKSQPLTPQQSNCKTLCNSFQSVAHIEKAQKSDTYEVAPFSQSAFDVCSRKNYNKNELISPTNYKTEHVKKEECKINLNTIENSMKSINIGPSVEEVEKFPQNLLLRDDEFPELIPPGMLLTPDLSESVKLDVFDIDKKTVKNTLSKKELIEAMEYLLKNDAQFTDKLYEAYLKTRTK
ncbi:hypothetical protein PGB90_009198 [Kerria lacca]